MPGGNSGRGGGRGGRGNKGKRWGENQNAYNSYGGDSILSSFKRWFSGTGNGSQGAGRGRGMGRGVRNFNDSTPSSRNNEYYDTNFRESGYRQEEQRQTDPQTLSREQSLNEANQLKEQAERLKEELNNIHKKINTLNSKKKNTEPKLTVDKSLCTACGICRDLCPRKAITVRDFAEIDQNLCTLCGRCVSQCPAGALQIQ